MSTGTLPPAMSGAEWTSSAAHVLARLAAEFGEPEPCGDECIWWLPCPDGGAGRLTLARAFGFTAPVARFELAAQSLHGTGSYYSVIDADERLNQLIEVVKAECLRPRGSDD
jgi:hypothetical protein